MNDQHNMSGSSHISWTYFPESDDKLAYYVMKISASSCVEKRSCQSILTPPATSHLQVAIWKIALLESPLNMNSKMVRILTTRVSCVHEQYHLIHLRHLQIYCSSPTTSANNLDVGLQAAVPSYDARYFVYERVAKQGIIHSHENILKAKSLTI